MKLILSLFDYTGNWCQPYRDAGYIVEQYDIKHGQDVRLIPAFTMPVHGILAAVPCTEFAGSGARWWEGKGEQPLLDALALVDATLRLVALNRPAWWVIENPVGRLKRWIGEPRMYFHPADYGDPYTKKTGLWGDFNPPVKRPVEATEGSKMHRLPPSDNRQELRSVTPAGFAKAFFEANP